MANLSYDEKGKGQPVVLIHGFPFHRKLWNGFGEKLASNFRVFTVDLPGFGDSPLLSAGFTIDSVAESILKWMEGMKIHECFMVGHSLGGYVALAMAKMDPARFKGFVLFHSSALADNDEKKQSRNKVIEFIGKNGVKAFTSSFIGPLFADQRHPAIDKVRKIAEEASAEAVKGYVFAMRDRSDRTDVLKTFTGKILFIGGEKDPGIPVTSIEGQAVLNPRIQVEILHNVGHMGMFEAPETSAEKIQTFLKS